MASNLKLYFHTLRHLKLSQVYWRIWYRFFRPRVDYSRQADLRLVAGDWVVPARRRKSLDEGEKFNFLNQIGHLGEIGWDGAQREKLWRYNQHYFDDLNAVDFEDRSVWHHALVKRWVRENLPGEGTGWEPYPTSLRIVNWVKWQLGGHPLDDDCLHSLAIQTRWLNRKIEWHILGNHLFANAKALVFSGLNFSGHEAEKWLRKGLDIIMHELQEQVLPDGGNFERSPMYHAIFLEDLLDLINISEAYPGGIEKKYGNLWRSTAIKMLDWLDAMCHPDGEITFFNDSAIGIAPSPSELNAYSSRLGIVVEKVTKSFDKPSVRQFTESGYIRLDAKNAALFLDVAPVGPDYLPGHAHADTLSFELSLFGERVLVNGGTSQYGTGPLRLEERGTEAHNTVVIDGKNSSEVWSGFRVARRAYPKGLEIDLRGQSIYVSCAHDGYAHLPGRVEHNRSWQLGYGKLIVRDWVDGYFKSAVARFNFHPDIQVDTIDSRSYLLRLPVSGQEIKFSIISGAGGIERSFFAPEFGVRINSQCLAVRFDSDNDITVEISWGING